MVEGPPQAREEPTLPLSSEFPPPNKNLREEIEEIKALREEALTILRELRGGDP